MQKGIVGHALCVIFIPLPTAQTPNCPSAGQRAHKPPAELGFDPAKLTSAVEFMKSS